MPRLWILSDLHLEAAPFPDAYDPPRPGFDVLVAAGDIWRGGPEKAVATVARLAAGRPAVFVAGNHEPWGMTPARCMARLKRAAKGTDVTVLDGEGAAIAGVRFIGATLWADGLLSGLHLRPLQTTGEGVLSPSGQGTITHGDEAALHAAERRRIAALLEQAPDGLPMVVVTHHAPLTDRMPPGLRAHPGAGLFASDLSTLMTGNRIALWVYGHIHAREDRLHDSGARIVANPAGPLFSTPGFEDDCVVTVGAGMDLKTRRED